MESTEKLVFTARKRSLLSRDNTYVMRVSSEFKNFVITLQNATGLTEAQITARIYDFIEGKTVIKDNNDE